MTAKGFTNLAFAALATGFLYAQDAAKDAPKEGAEAEAPAENVELENEIKYIAPNSEVTIVTYEDEILGVLLPAKAILTVTKTEPGVRGDTVSNGGSKDAELETGITIRVPLFINEGDKISVDTSTGKYDGRA